MQESPDSAVLDTVLSRIRRMTLPRSVTEGNCRIDRVTADAPDRPAGAAPGRLALHGDTGRQDVGIQHMPAELQLGIASFLGFDDRHRLRRVNRGFRELLGGACPEHRLLARCRWAASASQVRNVLADIAAEAPAVRASLLDALATRLLTGGRELERACLCELLDAIAALPPALMPGPLQTILRQSWNLSRADDRPALMRLQQLVASVPPEARGAMMVLALKSRLTQNQRLSQDEVARYLATARTLSAEPRAALLETLVRTYAGAREPAVADELLRVALSFRGPDGKPLARQLPLLLTVISTVRWHRIREDDATWVMWNTLLDAAREQGPREAAPLLWALLEVLDDVEVDPGIAAALGARLYDVAATMPDEVEVFLGASRNGLASQDELEVADWHSFLERIRTLEAPTQAWLLTAFVAEFFNDDVNDDDDLPAWRELRRTGLKRIGELSPPELQIAPLQAWLAELGSLPDPVEEAHSWQAAFRLMSPFPAATRAGLLAACMASRNLLGAPWDPLLLRSLQLPPQVRGEPLLRMAKRLPMLPQWGRRTDQWRTLLEGARELPPAQWMDMLALLWRALQSLPEADRPDCRKELEACITQLPLSRRARVLVRVARNAHGAQELASIVALSRQLDADRRRCRLGGLPMIPFTAEVVAEVLCRAIIEGQTAHDRLPAEMERLLASLQQAVGDLEADARELPLGRLLEVANRMPSLPRAIRGWILALMEEARASASPEPAQGRKRRASMQLTSAAAGEGAGPIG